MKHKGLIYSFTSIAILLLVWRLINIFQLVNPLFIPDVTDTFTKVFKLLSEKPTYQSIGITLYRAFTGLFLAILLGIPMGLLLARIKWLYDFLKVPIEFFRAVPSSALFPLFVLFFGIGDASKISVVFYACSLILIINAYYGALQTQEKLERINMLKSFGATNQQLLKHTVFQDALPNISAGLRVCLSYSFALVVVTEMFLGANSGLGRMIYDYYLQYRIPEMYASIIILGVLGFFINQIYIYIENKHLYWIKK